MKINIEQNIPNPKSFGIVFSGVFFCLELYIFIYKNYIFFYFIPLCIILLLISFLKPNILIIPNQIWFKFGNLLGKITNPILLFIIFYLFFFPSSLLIRIFKRNLLNKKPDGKIITYWETRNTKVNSMKGQF